MFEDDENVTSGSHYCGKATCDKKWLWVISLIFRRKGSL